MADAEKPRTAGRPRVYPHGHHQCTLRVPIEDHTLITIIAARKGISRERWLKRAVAAALRAEGYTPVMAVEQPYDRTAGVLDES